MSKDDFNELRQSFDVQDPFMTTGHQIVKMRRGNRETPDWAKNKQEIQKVLLLAFPKMRANATQRIRAGRWVRALYLYYNTNMTQSQVAEEMGVSPKTVNNVLYRASLVAKGKRTDKPNISRGLPVGRPKKRKT